MYIVWQIQIQDMYIHCVSNFSGIAVSITTTANWTGNFIIALSTPILLNSSLQTHGTFYILAALLLLATTFVLFTLPETKGESLEKIDELFSKPWLERINLFYYLRLGCPWWTRRQESYSIAGGDLQCRNGDTAMLLQETESENELYDKKETSFIVETNHSANVHVSSVPQETND
jgi:hypothetical protein